MNEEAKLLVGLTKSQCRNVAEFIEFYLIECIRDDTSIDNIEWIESMLDARNILKEAAHGTHS